jgi:hypothetical protein
MGTVVAQSVWCLTADRSTGVRSLAEAKGFSFSLCVHTSSEAHPASYPVGTEGKARPELDADHSLHLVPRSWMSRSPCRLHGGSGTLYFSDREPENEMRGNTFYCDISKLDPQHLLWIFYLSEPLTALAYVSYHTNARPVLARMCVSFLPLNTV